MPADSSPDRSEEIYRCPSLTVRAVALRSSQATYRSRSMGLSSPQTAETETSSAPSHLSSDQLSLWCENIVRAMFMPTSQGKEDTADSPDFIRYTRPDSRYPLPLPNPDETHTNMVYICQAPPVLGKFDNKKATQLRVPNGPIRRNLVMGRTIEFEDNKVEGGRRIVKPEDVVSHGSSGSVSYG